MMYAYSKKERSLFDVLGMTDMISSNSLGPINAYKYAAYLCFMNEDIYDDNIKDSVRRCCQHLDVYPPSIYRMTKEFDNLIEIESIFEEA